MRRGAMVVVILGIAAAAAAMWDRYAPPSACLFCTAPEHYDTALNVTPDAVGTTGAAEGPRRNQYAAANPSAIPGPAYADAAGGARSSQQSDGRRGWTPWGKGTEVHRYGSSEVGGPDVSMGGLWRLMTLAHRTPEPVAASAPRAARTAQPATSGRPTPKPPRVGAPGPRAPAAPPLAAPVATVVAPTNPFTGFVSGPSDPFQPPPPGGSLDPGGPGGIGSTGGGTSATPEPASLLLIGTGLLLLAGELRRRRVI